MDFMDIITEDKIKEIEDLINSYSIKIEETHTKNNITDYLASYKPQINFFIRLFTSGYLHKEDTILEFGPGAGYGIFVGNTLGYNIKGIDIDHKELGIDIYNKFRRVLNIEDIVYTYKGVGKLPFDSDSFSTIIAKNSIHRFYSVPMPTKKRTEQEKENLEKERFKEFNRICMDDFIMYIKGKKIANWTKLRSNKYMNKKGTIYRVCPSKGFMVIEPV